MRPRLLTPEALRAALRAAGVTTASELAAKLEVSQPTISRGLNQLGRGVLRLGRTRGARYALPEPVAGLGSQWPLYRIDASGQARQLGELHSLAGGQWFFESSEPRPALMHGDFSSGLYPDLPWFLEDQRPQGFLGRNFVQAHAATLGAPEELNLWNSRHVLAALVLHGSDLPGDLVLGDGALRRALLDGTGPQAFAPGERNVRYPALAAAAIAGDRAGSSAGGEQPKFTAVLGDAAAGFRSVVVKFSDAITTPTSQRWSDLLLCEHLAERRLAQAGFPAAETEILDSQERRFLQSTRHDRTPSLGRRGQVSLRALDAACLGMARAPWVDVADRLVVEGWTTPETRDCIRVLGLFGDLIGNTDMHFGNLAFVLGDRKPLALTPVFDMLPMAYAPAAGGAVVPREFNPSPPLPRHAAAWSIAATLAAAFWADVASDDRASPGFRNIADRNHETLASLRRRFGEP